MNRQRTLKEYLYLVFAGFTMGVANVIPGVSGGTMAFIMGVFEELIDAISELTSPETLKMALHFRFGEMYRKLPWRFLLGLGAGILIAFAGVSKLFVFLLDKYPDFTYAFFFGLIAGSVLIVGRMVKKWSVSAAASLAAGALVAYQVITLTPANTPNVWYITVVCGMIAICAMILPGISGSFLLLILGQYQLVWGTIGDSAAGKISWEGGKVLLFLAVGCVIGLGVFVHLLKFFFRKWHSQTVAALIGFMLGSIPRLWPWQRAVEFMESKGKLVPVRIELLAPDAYGFGGRFFLILGLMLLGLVMVLAIELAAARKNRAEEATEDAAEDAAAAEEKGC